MALNLYRKYRFCPCKTRHAGVENVQLVPRPQVRPLTKRVKSTSALTCRDGGQTNSRGTPDVTGAAKILTPNEAWLQAIQRTAALGNRPDVTLAALVRETAQRTPDAPAILSDTDHFTYRELADRAAHYAAWAAALGLGKGDAVALMMSNRPDYVAIWLGVTQTGATVALLNTNLSGASLLHCLHAHMQYCGTSYDPPSHKFEI